MFIPTDKPEKVEIPETPDLAKLFEGYKGREAIAAGEAFDVSPANINARTAKRTLPEGIKVALLPKKSRGEIVYLKLTLRYGSVESLRHVAAADFLPASCGAARKA